MVGKLLVFKFMYRIALPILALTAATSTTGASAATVLATLNSIGTGNTINLHVVRPNGTPFAAQVLNGMATFTRTGGTDTTQLAGSGNTFFAFCLEPFEDAQLNANYSFTVDPLSSGAKSSLAGGIGAVKATQIGELFGQFAPNLSVAMSAIQASALQLAIWEIVSELSTNPFDISAGNTYFTSSGSANTSDVLNLAQSYLNYVTAANGNGPQAQGLEALTVSGNQDFLVQVVNTTPEPGTWMMMLIGFGLTGFVIRRKRAAATGAADEAAPSR